MDDFNQQVNHLIDQSSAIVEFTQRNSMDVCVLFIFMPSTLVAGYTTDDATRTQVLQLGQCRERINRDFARVRTGLDYAVYARLPLSEDVLVPMSRSRANVP